MVIKNGSTIIKSIGCEKDFESTPDDRIDLVKTFTSNGTSNVVVEDYGVVDNGEKITATAVFSASDFNVLKTLWSARTLCEVTFNDGRIVNNARVLIRRVQYYDDLINSYKKVSLEVWLV